MSDMNEILNRIDRELNEELKVFDKQIDDWPKKFTNPVNVLEDAYNKREEILFDLDILNTFRMFYIQRSQGMPNYKVLTMAHP